MLTWLQVLFFNLLLSECFSCADKIAFWGSCYQPLLVADQQPIA